MRKLCVSGSNVETCDRLAMAFGCLYNPTPNNSIKPNVLPDDATRNIDAVNIDDVNSESKTGAIGGGVCQYILFNPCEFHYFLLRSPRFSRSWDRECCQKLVKRGIVGYLWGATVVLDKNVKLGHIVLTSDVREKALRSKKSIVVEMQSFDKITDFEGVAEEHIDWTEDET